MTAPTQDRPGSFQGTLAPVAAAFAAFGGIALASWAFHLVGFVLSSAVAVSAAALWYAASLHRKYTRHMRVEQAQGQSEAQFRGAFENTNVPTVLTDIDNRFVRFNAA